MRTSVDPIALRAARERAGYTQHQLARLIGVAGGERVSRWELGTSEPRPDIFFRLADVLNIDALALIQSTQPRPDLRALRYAAGLAAEDIAAAVHVSVSTYLHWETGRSKRLPAAHQLDALAGVLEVDLEDVTAALNQARPTPIKE